MYGSDKNGLSESDLKLKVASKQVVSNILLAIRDKPKTVQEISEETGSQEPTIRSWLDVFVSMRVITEKPRPRGIISGPKPMEYGRNWNISTSSED